MAVFPPLAHAQQRVVAGLRQELAQIPHPKMAGLLVSANLAKHAKRKLVTVAQVVSAPPPLSLAFSVYLSVCLSLCVCASLSHTHTLSGFLYCSAFEGAVIGSIKILIARFVASSLSCLVFG